MKLLSGKARQSRRQRALRLLEKQVERYRSRIEQLKDSKKAFEQKWCKAANERIGTALKEINILEERLGI
jgi:hypothetical protein